MARRPTVTRDMMPEEFREAFHELTNDAGGAITDGSYSRQEDRAARLDGVTIGLYPANPTVGGGSWADGT